MRRIDREHFAVVRRGHRTYVKPFPISIDPEPWSKLPKGRTREADVRLTRDRLGLGDARLIFGVDRLDYTKGIPERIKAFERMLEYNPEWRGRVTLLQVGAPSREHLQRYQTISDDVGSEPSTSGLAAMDGGQRSLRQHHGLDDVARCIERRRLRGLVTAIYESGRQGVHRISPRPAGRWSSGSPLLASCVEAVDVNLLAVDEFAGVLHRR
jgi:hypothetical protein